MKFRINILKFKKKKQINYVELLPLSFFFLLFSIKIFSQDSIPLAKDLTEEKELKFQEHFFKALSEKSIKNYQKALENLEMCNQILPNDMAVFFEFSKNYLLLNNTLEAKEYILRALEKDAKNSWLLKHLVSIHKKDRNFVEAIKIQQKIIALDSKEKENLVYLYYQNKEYIPILPLIDSIEKEKGLSVRLKKLKEVLKKKAPTTLVQKKKDTNPGDLLNEYKNNKSYAVLKKILNKYQSNTSILLTYSLEGISLFPAQAYVYLMKGKALNNQKEYTKALEALKNGIDFVIEENMEAKFYIEMAIAHKGLGNKSEEKKYREKSKKAKK